ncbi:uncharacterized protein LOC143557235 [Bidens hawaiensis]|uniref:uncharacterized protein LOC143557235 n=1 Tax=Bidens hawaiensis TaxID=980011 RepID=UPI00404902E5
MSSGLQRRKPNNKKKKNKAKPDRKPHSRLGESDGDQHSFPHPEVSADNSEGSSSGYESLTPVTTQKSAKDRLSKLEIDKPWNSPRQVKLKMDFSKAAMMEVETPTVAEYLSQPFEFSPENETRKANDMAFKTPKSVDQTLAEVVSKLPFEFPYENETQKANDLGFKTPTFVDLVKSVDQTLAEVASKLPFEFPSENETQKANDLGFKTPTLVDPVKSVDQTLAEVASKLPFEFSSEMETQKGNNLGFKTPTFVDPVKSADQTLAEVASKLPFEFSPETETQKSNDLGFKTPTFVDPVNSVDQTLVEVASKLPFEFPSENETQKVKDSGFKTPTLVDPVKSVEQTLAEVASKLPFEFSSEMESQKVNDMGYKTPTLVDPVESVDQSLVEAASKLPFEFSSEKETQKANDLGFKTPTLVDPVASIDQTLVEVVSKLNKDTKTQEKDDFTVAETHVEHTVINEIDKPLNSTEQANIKIDKAAMMELEPPSVADYLSQPFESSPEKGTHKVEDLGFKTPTFVDAVVSVDQTLVEVASQLDNNIRVEEKDDLAAAETLLEERTVINETEYRSKENEVQMLDSPKPKKKLLQDSTNGKCPYCGRGGDDERQPLLASAPQPPEKASWKNCCGLFELFSGSTRN